MAARVQVVIVNWNGEEYLADCLRAVAAQDHAGPLDVLVVDNGSTDGSLDLLRRDFPGVEVVRSPRNNYAAANNLGVARGRGPFALLLNPDCEISIQAVQQLLRTAAQWPDAAMVAPQLLQANGQPEVNYRWPSLLWKSVGPAVTEGPACVGFVCGAAMLLRMNAFDGQFFDEQFFLYYEDDDLCTRLFKQRQAMLIDPAATAIHRSRGSVRGRSPLRSEYIRGYHHAQSKLTYAAKHVNAASARRLRIRLLWQTLLALPLRLALFSPKLITRMWGRCIGVSRWSNKGPQ